MIWPGPSWTGPGDLNGDWGRTRGRREQAELQHHAELVGDATVLDHLPVLKAADVDDICEAPLACRRVAGEAP